MNNPFQNNRRKFIKNVSMGTLATLAVPGIVSAATNFSASKKVALSKDDIILFQGDSITDWGRDKKQSDPNDFGTLGSGYVLLTATNLLSHYPEKTFKIYNKGVSGNKVFEMADRWQTDCLDLKPTVLSVMIGVNDFWHTLTYGYTGTIQTYRDDYKKLLDRTKQQLPNVKLIIGEPFAIKGVKAVNEKWYPTFDTFRAAAKDIANQYDAAFIPYQSIFDKAMEFAPGSYWTSDGVHPTTAGAGLMAQAWLDTVKG